MRGSDEQRHLPGHAALAVGVVVELVHHDVGRVERARPPRSAMFASTSAVQQTIGASRVDARVAGQHADVLGAEVVAEREELLADASALIGLV